MNSLSPQMSGRTQLEMLPIINAKLLRIFFFKTQAATYL